MGVTSCLLSVCLGLALLRGMSLSTCLDQSFDEVDMFSSWQRILDLLDHLLRRPILHAGSAMLDYDLEYFFLHHEINCFIP